MHVHRIVHRFIGFVIVAYAGVLPWSVDATPASPGDGSAAPEKPKHSKARTKATSKSDGSTQGRGLASFYSKHLAGNKTSSGQRYDPHALTAAHRSLPMGTKVKVVNPKNDKSVVVTVNDRGPVPKNRMIDLSGAAAKELGMTKAGVTKVDTEVVGKSELPNTGAAKSDAKADTKADAKP